MGARVREQQLQRVVGEGNKRVCNELDQAEQRQPRVGRARGEGNWVERNTSNVVVLLDRRGSCTGTKTASLARQHTRARPPGAGGNPGSTVLRHGGKQRVLAHNCQNEG